MCLKSVESRWFKAKRVERYLTEHGITAKRSPIKGEDGREVTLRGERRKLKGLVKDRRGEAIDDSWEWGTFH